jgi:hypothetical protein
VRGAAGHISRNLADFKAGLIKGTLVACGGSFLRIIYGYLQVRAATLQNCQPFKTFRPDRTCPEPLGKGGVGVAQRALSAARAVLAGAADVEVAAEADAALPREVRRRLQQSVNQLPRHCCSR